MIINNNTITAVRLKEWNDDTIHEYYEKYNEKILEIINDVQTAKPNEKQKCFLIIKTHF